MTAFYRNSRSTITLQANPCQPMTGPKSRWSVNEETIRTPGERGIPLSTVPKEGRLYPWGDPGQPNHTAGGCEAFKKKGMQRVERKAHLHRGLQDGGLASGVLLEVLELFPLGPPCWVPGGSFGPRQNTGHTGGNVSESRPPLNATSLPHVRWAGRQRFFTLAT